MTDLLTQLTADLRESDRAEIAASLGAELADDAIVLETRQLRERLRAADRGDRVLLMLVALSAERQLRQRAVLSCWRLLADLLDADASTLEQVLVLLARERIEGESK